MTWLPLCSCCHLILHHVFLWSLVHTATDAYAGCESIRPSQCMRHGRRAEGIPVRSTASPLQSIHWLLSWLRRCQAASPAAVLLAMLFCVLQVAEGVGALHLNICSRHASGSPEVVQLSGPMHRVCTPHATVSSHTADRQLLAHDLQLKTPLLAASCQSGR